MKKQDRLRKRAATREKRLNEKRFAKALKCEALADRMKKRTLERSLVRKGKK